MSVSFYWVYHFTGVTSSSKTKVYHFEKCIILEFFLEFKNGICNCEVILSCPLSSHVPCCVCRSSLNSIPNIIHFLYQDYQHLENWNCIILKVYHFTECIILLELAVPQKKWKKCIILVSVSFYWVYHFTEKPLYWKSCPFTIF